MSKPISSISYDKGFNFGLVKDKHTLENFIKYLKDSKLDPNVYLKITDNRLLIGIYLDWLEKNYNIGIHADNSCFIVYYININNLKGVVLPYYKSNGFTPYIYEWYALTPEDLATAWINYCTAIHYVINRLTSLPF